MDNNTGATTRNVEVPSLCVFPNRFARGWNGPDDTGVSTWEVWDGLKVLEHRYSTDAHLCVYLAEGPWGAGQPRLKVGAAGEDGVRITVPWFFVDIDNADHGGWASDEEARRVCEGWKRAYPTAGVYSTSGGGRIVFWLDPVWTAEEFGGRARALLAAVASRLGLQVSKKGAAAPSGLHVDGRSDEWTRLYRLPLVRRDGVDVSPAFMDLSGMEGFEWTRSAGVGVRRMVAKVPTSGSLAERVTRLGGYLTDNNYARKLPCPACGDSTVWWDMCATTALCGHRKTCQWKGNINLVLGGSR